MRCVVETVTMGQAFLQYFGFPLSVSLHQSSILIFSYMLLLPEGYSLRAGKSWDRIPVRTRFSAPVQTGPGDNPVSYTMGTGSLPGVKRPKRGFNHPSLPNAEVKERVEQLFYPPSVPSWLVTRRALPLLYQKGKTDGS